MSEDELDLDALDLSATKKTLRRKKDDGITRVYVDSINRLCDSITHLLFSFPFPRVPQLTKIILLFPSCFMIAGHRRGRPRRRRGFLDLSIGGWFGRLRRGC